MSLNPVSSFLLPYYGPLAPANSSPTAKSAAPAKEAPDTTAPKQSVTPSVSSNSDTGAQVESTLERALRQARISTGTSTSGESNTGSGRQTPAISLYQRVSQYSDDRSSASGLLKSWSDIVRENQFDDAGVAAYAKAVTQNDAVGLPSHVLHLTA